MLGEDFTIDVWYPSSGIQRLDPVPTDMPVPEGHTEFKRTEPKRRVVVHDQETIDGQTFARTSVYEDGVLAARHLINDKRIRG